MRRILTTPEKHQLRIARDTLKMSDMGARIMGGPSKPESRRIIFSLTGRWPCDHHPSRRATSSKYTELLCEPCTGEVGGLVFPITPKLTAEMPSIFGKEGDERSQRVIREWNILQVEAPFDSGDFPKAILVAGDDVAATACGECGAPAEEWPRDRQGYHPGCWPGVMYQADLYCTACFPFAYDEETGERVNAYTGEPQS